MLCSDGASSISVSHHDVIIHTRSTLISHTLFSYPPALIIIFVCSIYLPIISVSFTLLSHRCRPQHVHGVFLLFSLLFPSRSVLPSPLSVPEKINFYGPRNTHYLLFGISNVQDSPDGDNGQKYTTADGYTHNESQIWQTLGRVCW